MGRREKHHIGVLESNYRREHPSAGKTENLGMETRVLFLFCVTICVLFNFPEPSAVSSVKEDGKNSCLTYPMGLLEGSNKERFVKYFVNQHCQAHLSGDR